MTFLITATVPNIFNTRDRFCGRQFFHGPGVGWGWGVGGRGSGGNASDGEVANEASLACRSSPAVRPGS